MDTSLEAQELFRAYVSYEEEGEGGIFYSLADDEKVEEEEQEEEEGVENEGNDDEKIDKGEGNDKVTEASGKKKRTRKRKRGKKGVSGEVSLPIPDKEGSKRKRHRPMRSGLKVYREKVEELRGYKRVKEKCQPAENPAFVSCSSYLEVEEVSTNTYHKAHFIKTEKLKDGLAYLNKIQRVVKHVEQVPPKYWEWVNDSNRGPKPFLTVGEWVEQGKDKVHIAGEGGRQESLCPFLTPALVELGLALTSVLVDQRPELMKPLMETGWESLYGCFHLFMIASGSATFHVDRDDFISVLVPLKMDFRKKGGLEIGQVGVCFSWSTGDIVIMDSERLLHATRKYEGETRWVGIFLIHRRYLRAKKVAEKIWRKKKGVQKGEKLKK